MTTNATRKQEPDVSNIDHRPTSEADSETATHTVYRGERNPSHPVGEEVRVTVDSDTLAERQDLKNHSPAGFEFGYGGSGPAQLALAVLAHHTDDETALHEYGAFKSEVVAELPGHGDGAATWEVSSTEVEAFLSERSGGGERR
jgi:hypothetical protein